MASTPDPPPSGASVYGALLKAELAAQEARKASFEQRGLAVVTSSGVLVTLLLALAAFTRGGTQTFVLPAAARTSLTIALVLFVSGAVAALITNLPIFYDAIPADAIRGRLKDHRDWDATRADRDVALTRVKTLRDAKSKNTFKGWALFAALVLQVLAVVAVAVAVASAVSTQAPTRPVVGGPTGPSGHIGPTGPRGPRGYPATPDEP